ncbi:MAG: hypothetical protein R3348_00355 [Xanthomonadales bacterium]|nr:hypothetical protein [Xanthomonadales bacterium]
MSATTLHIVFSADRGTLSACLAVVQSGDSMLLADRGVIALCEPGTGFPGGVRLFALAADLAAHVAEQTTSTHDFEPIEDDEWPVLLTAHERVLSWP